MSFDRIKGYGFVTPDVGGDDVFIHVNDLYSDKHLLTQGSIVEFRLDEGDRGPKASEVTVITTPPAPTVAPTPLSVVPTTTPSTSDAATTVTDTDPEFCDTLSAGEFEHEITEALLRVAPDLTSSQIVDVRKRMLRVAQGHSWIDR